MTKTVLARRAYFSAAHKLSALYGAQVSTHGQGHNYVLEAYVEGTVDPRSGMLMTIARLDEMLGELTAGLDHKFLNYDVKYFADGPHEGPHGVQPTAANLAKYCYDFLQPLVARHASSTRLQKVRLYETDDYWVDYGADGAPEI